MNSEEAGTPTPAKSAFYGRLRELGFSTYAEYLAADHWRQFKEQYRAAKLPMKCAVCEAKPIQLHHHTYQRLGCELLTDVDPLCRGCHQAVHEWLKRHKNNNVQATHKAIKALRHIERAAGKAEGRKAAPAASRKAAELAVAKKRHDHLLGVLGGLRLKTPTNPFWLRWPKYCKQTRRQLKQTIHAARQLQQTEADAKEISARGGARSAAKEAREAKQRSKKHRRRETAAELARRKAGTQKATPVRPVQADEITLQMRAIAAGFRRPFRGR